MNQQKGNALFLILIAVALFAALSYAITQSGRGGSGSIKKETDAIIGAQIVQLSANIRSAVTRMRVGGVPAADIVFTLPDGSGPCTVTDGTCVFTPEGGGMTVPVVGRDIPQAAYDPIYYGSPLNLLFVKVNEGDTASGMPSTAVAGAGGDGSDGAMALIGITRGVCEAINRGLGITGIPLVDPVALMATMPDHQTVDVGGKLEGCMDMTDVIGPDTYEFFSVLIEN